MTLKTVVREWTLMAMETMKKWILSLSLNLKWMKVILPLLHTPLPVPSVFMEGLHQFVKPLFPHGSTSTAPFPHGSTSSSLVFVVVLSSLLDTWSHVKGS